MGTFPRLETGYGITRVFALSEVAVYAIFDDVFHRVRGRVEEFRDCVRLAQTERFVDVNSESSLGFALYNVLQPRLTQIIRLTGTELDEKAGLRDACRVLRRGFTGIVPL